MKNIEFFSDHFDPVVGPSDAVSPGVAADPLENVFNSAFENNEVRYRHFPVYVCRLFLMPRQPVEHQNIVPAEAAPAHKRIDDLLRYGEMLVFEQQPFFEHIPDKDMLLTAESFGCGLLLSEGPQLMAKIEMQAPSSSETIFFETGPEGCFSHSCWTYEQHRAGPHIFLIQNA